VDAMKKLILATFLAAVFPIGSASGVTTYNCMLIKDDASFLLNNYMETQSLSRSAVEERQEIRKKTYKSNDKTKLANAHKKINMLEQNLKYFERDMDKYVGKAAKLANIFSAFCK